MQSKITLDFQGLNEQELRRVHETINTMFERDVFFMKNGQVILHYDHEGVLQEIGFNYKRWKRRKH